LLSPFRLVTLYPNTKRGEVFVTIDAAAATAKYIDSLGPAALEKAASYTSGNHWLLLWGLVVSAIVTWIMIHFRILDRIWAKIEHRGWGLKTFVVSSLFILISSILPFPWDLYSEYWRELSYGRTTQPLSDWLVQFGISIALATIGLGLFFLGVYALIRKTGKRWWLWSGGLTVTVFVAVVTLSPILIEPIFNDYKPVPEGPVRTALLKMADEANIPHDRIFMYDGSRQSENFTANVSGLFGSARIAISDVALKKTSLDEVKAVTGHEVGHYVLGHVWRSLLVVALTVMLAFFLADRLYPKLARAFGSDTELGDPRGIPVFVFMIALLLSVTSPITNTLSRWDEAEADNYSLKTVNLPDGLSSALVKTAEYRYPRPSALQEFLFYTHPSVEWRVRNAMEWKAKNKGQ
jgi:STE24 endopeptidase